jgi:hypothetical protein
MRNLLAFLLLLLAACQPTEYARDKAFCIDFYTTHPERSPWAINGKVSAKAIDADCTSWASERNKNAHVP